MATPCALVNKIIPFSSVDGPGNRTAVFLQGCNFDCVYCHNPETIHLCCHCGACVPACPTGALSLAGGEANYQGVHHAQPLPPAAGSHHVAYDHTKCIHCDACIRICPHGASPRIRIMTAEELMREVEKQLPYIRGVTVSGGECTLQRDFLTAFFTLAKDRGLSCLLDSNGSLDFAKDPALLAVTDGVMLDIKAFPANEHRTVTGQDNALVLQNAAWLASKGKLPEVRTVLVPGLFDGEATVRATAQLLAPYLKDGPIRYRLIRFRPMGVREAYRNFPTPAREAAEALAREVAALGFDTAVS